MATGDLRNNAQAFVRLLHTVKMEDRPSPVQVARGLPETLLPCIHYALLQMSAPLAAQLVRRGFHLLGLSDAKFMEAAFKLAREAFDLSPGMNLNQFFATGFAERKLLFCTALVRAAHELATRLGRQEELRQSSVRAASTGERDELFARLYAPKHAAENGNDENAAANVGPGSSRADRGKKAQAGSKKKSGRAKALGNSKPAKGEKVQPRTGGATPLQTHVEILDVDTTAAPKDKVGARVVRFSDDVEVFPVTPRSEQESPERGVPVEFMSPSPSPTSSFGMMRDSPADSMDGSLCPADFPAATSTVRSVARMQAALRETRVDALDVSPLLAARGNNWRGVSAVEPAHPDPFIWTTAGQVPNQSEPHRGPRIVEGANVRPVSPVSNLMTYLDESTELTTVAHARVAANDSEEGDTVQVLLKRVEQLEHQLAAKSPGEAPMVQTPPASHDSSIQATLDRISRRFQETIELSSK